MMTPAHLTSLQALGTPQADLNHPHPAINRIGSPQRCTCFNFKESKFVMNLSMVSVSNQHKKLQMRCRFRLIAWKPYMSCLTPLSSDVCLYVCMSVCLYVCMYVCDVMFFHTKSYNVMLCYIMYVCMYVCMYV